MNPFKEVDELFEVFVDDGLSRFILFNLPFWFITFLISWNICFYFLPWALIIGLLGLFVPYAFGSFLLIFYRSNEGQSFKRLYVAMGVFTVMSVLLIGVPGLHEGWVMDGIRSKVFNGLFNGALKGFWSFMNMIWPFSNRDIPASFYQYQYKSAQIVFLISSCVVSPVVAFFRAVGLEVLREERVKQEFEVEEERRELDLKHGQSLEDEKEQEEESNEEELDLEHEKEQKRLVKNKKKSVEDNDPWGSGFL